MHNYKTLFTIFTNDILGNWYEKLGEEILKIDDVKFVNGYKTIYCSHGVPSGRNKRSLAITCTSAGLMMPYIKKNKLFKYIGKRDRSDIYEGKLLGKTIIIDGNTDGVNIEFEDGIKPQEALDMSISLLESFSIKKSRNRKLKELDFGG